MDAGVDLPASVGFGRFRMLPHRREMITDGKPIKLGGRAFDILVALIEARGAVVTKDAMMKRVWPGRVVEENNLQSHIAALRAVLGPDRDLIRTVSGRGYQFIGETRPLSEAGDERARLGPEKAESGALAFTNVPEPVSELIGRVDELADVVNLIGAHRLVTLTGAGGIGKTRLGFEAARRQLPNFTDGVWAVELAPLSDPDLVPATVANALGLGLAWGTASPRSVADALRSKRFMLVLDNCEHMVDAAAQMAEAFLHANTAARVIATSREPLRAEGEWVYPVPPLTVPPEGHPDGEDPVRYSAVRLFCERAHAAAATFAHDARSAAIIAGICRRLDGLPLAIELAAAHAAALGIESLSARIDDRFRLLTRGCRTAMPRHQTLQGTFDWSYALLTEPERVGLRRLAIFAGGFATRDACAVAADDEITTLEVVDCLASLVAKSLVTADFGSAMPRYRLLETTRAYVLEKLVQSGEFDAVARRHASHYLDLFERAEAEAETRPTQEWLADHGPQIDNLRAALDWAFSPSGDTSIGMALTVAAVPLWVHLSPAEECRDRVERALAAMAAAAGRDAHREMQLNAAFAASLKYSRGAVAEIEASATRALQLAESRDDIEYQLRALWHLWSLRISASQHRAALTMAERFQSLVAKRYDPSDRLIGERMIGVSRHYCGDLLNARRHLERVLAYDAAPARTLQFVRFQVDPWAGARAFLSRILWLQGLPDQAMRSAETSVAEARATHHATSLGLALAVAACPIALWSADLTAAGHYVDMLLDQSARHLLRRWSTFGRCYQGILVIQRGDFESGIQLLRATLAESTTAESVARLSAFIISATSRHAGQIADGLPAIEEAIVRSELTEERWLIAELLRVKGETLLWRGAPGAAAVAEGHFRRALDLARQQGALSWELRAATSLARLWRDQARSKAAHELLAPVYDRFTEGFTTADLRAAKSLLEELS
jgi:predicted ATPase/DNA-binding winged helix-turn-helix (wHTH) protein